MATYTLIQATSGSEQYMVGDNLGNLYVLCAPVGGINAVVYQYDIGADTLTDISGATFTSHRATYSFIAWFGTTLYLAITEPVGTDEVSIYEWQGAQNWTKVDNAACAAAGSNVSLAADRNRIAYRYTTPASARVMRASTDGTTWGTQTTSGGTATSVYYCRDRDELVVPTQTWPAPVNAHNLGSNWSAIGPSISIYFRGTCGTNRQIFGYTPGHPSGTKLYWSDDWGATLIDTGAVWTNLASVTYPRIFDLGWEGVMVGMRDAQHDDVSFWNDSTKTFDLDGTPSAGNALASEPCMYNGYLYVLGAAGIYVRDEPIVKVTYRPSPHIGDKADSMDVSADDYYLHIGVIFGGSPVELRLPSDLSANPSEMYAPGAGDCITVKCGDVEESWVWIAGNFGTPKVRASIDDGVTWITKDPGTWVGDARPLVVGPDEDNLVLVPSGGDDDLHETADGGLAWTTLNAGLPFDVGGMDRLDVNVEEIMIGSRIGRDIRYSPNRGYSFHDVSDASMPNDPITDVIMG